MNADPDSPSSALDAPGAGGAVRGAVDAAVDAAAGAAVGSTDVAPGANPAPRTALRLLGTAAWRVGEGTWKPLPRKDAALLARLALEGRQARTAMATWLWPEVPLARAHANLRQRLYKLRHGAAQALVDEAEDGLALAADVSADVRADGCAPDAAFDATLLDGLEPASDAVQDWIDEARRRWQTQRVDRMTGQAARHETAGELAAALALTERLLALEPLLEHAWRRLMRLHTLRGDRAAALAAFERCEQVLRDELGVRPAAETQALLHQVEAGTSAPGAIAAPGGARDAATNAPAPGALPASLLRPPRLAGRAPELQAMRAAWAGGQAFVLVGEAGMGKSRLLLELAAGGPSRVIESARPGDEGVPYGALVRLLRRMARVAPRPDALWPDAEAAQPERQELARLLPELGPAPLAPGLEVLLHGALEQVFGRAPAAGVQAVLLDDLHHADEASRAVFRRVSASGGLHWGFASRPDARGELSAWLASSARLQPILLAGLAAQPLHELLQACALPGIDVQRMAPALTRHCGGNPLFVLETLRQLLTEADRSGHAPDADAVLPLPPSVESVLAQRLSELPAAAQALARVAAVAGPEFSAEVAADVLEQPLLALAEPLAALEAAQVMTDGRFVHDMLCEAVLGHLPAVLRRPLHARVARSLRQRGAPPQRVAEHFDAGGLPAEAGAMAMAAAADARRLGRLAERVTRLRDAARWFEAAGDEAGVLQAQIEEVSARFAAEGPTPAVTALADALLAAAPRREIRIHLNLLRGGLALARFDIGRVGEAAAAAELEAEPGSTDALSAGLLSAAAQALSGDAAGAVERVQPLLIHLERCADPLLATDLWSYLAMVFANAGRPDECIHALQSQRRLAREVGKADDEVTALISLAGQYAQRGELELAVAVSQEAVAMQRRMGAGHGLAGALLNLALAQLGLWQLREALATLAATRETLAVAGTVGELLWIVDDAEGEVWLRAGQAERTLGVTEGQDAAAVSLPRRMARLALRARAHAALHQPEAAAALCREVLASPPGTLSMLRAQLLAVQGLAGAADERLPALSSAAAGQPHAVRAVAAWVNGEAAERRGDAGAALTAAREALALLPRARQASLPELPLWQWLCRTLDALAPADEAVAAREAARQWWQSVVLPGLPEGCAPDSGIAGVG